MNTSDFLQALRELSSSILRITGAMIENAAFDRTVKGRVAAVVNPGEYRISIRDHTYLVKSKSEYKAGQTVYVLIPCRDYQNLILL